MDGLAVSLKCWALSADDDTLILNKWIQLQLTKQNFVKKTKYYSPKQYYFYNSLKVPGTVNVCVYIINKTLLSKQEVNCLKSANIHK